MIAAGARFAADGRVVRLGRRLGGGGEGDVFAVALSTGLAAKIYTADPAAREAKVAAMLRARMGARAPLTAFPIAALRDEGGRFAGFLMPRIAHAQPLHELYAPGARKRAFPRADYRFIVRVALNAARAVAGAHRAGCVIGDVNHSGFLIGRDGLVALIDADSFQIEDGAIRHPCGVGVPEYTPAELQGASLAQVWRTPDHDAFGLAVVLFQLLFLGRHPHAGVARGDDLPVDLAIARHAFAFGPGAGPLTAPPDALRLDEVPPEVAALFLRAFAPDAAGRRPDAGTWVAALADFEAALAPCAAHPRHHHAAPACPWCRLEQGRRLALFPAPGEPGAAPRPADLRALRARLTAIRLPDRVAYAPPEPLPGSAPPPPTARAIWLNRLGVAALAGMMGCAAALVWVSPQNFLMASPICLYGYGPVRDALAPRRAMRRRLARLDRDLASAMADHQARAGLEAAWRLKATIAERLAAPGAVADVAPDLARLEALAATLAQAQTERLPEIETLLARREALATAMRAKDLPTPPRPVAAPRLLSAGARQRAARLGFQP